MNSQGPLTAEAMNRLLTALGLRADACAGEISAPYWEQMLLEIISRLPKKEVPNEAKRGD